MMRYFFILTALFCFIISAAGAERFDIPAPPLSATFGETVKVLPNGNFVVVDSLIDIQLNDTGAVYLYNGVTRELISRGRKYVTKLGSFEVRGRS